MSEDKGSGLLVGLILGAGIGAGLTFLFGTDKGKKIRNQLRSEYPEVFDRLDEVIGNLSEETQLIESKVEGVEEQAQEALADKLDSVANAVADLRDHVRVSHRFQKSGHKL